MHLLAVFLLTKVQLLKIIAVNSNKAEVKLNINVRWQNCKLKKLEIEKIVKHF